MTGRNVHDKTGKPIEAGDHVYTKIREGRHEGDVEDIVTSTSQAQKKGVENPPKVLFTDQKGKNVAHNPETLEVKEQYKEYESSNEIGA